MIHFARPPFLAESVTYLGPPHDVRLFDDLECAFVGALLVAGAITLVGDVLLVRNAVDPDLPVAADIAQQIDRLARGDGDVLVADAHLPVGGGATYFGRGHHTRERRDGVAERHVERDRRVVFAIGVEIGIPVDAPFAVRAALERTCAGFVVRSRRARLPRTATRGQRDDEENGASFHWHITGRGIGK